MEIKLTNEAKTDFRDMFNYYLEETQDAEHTRRIIQDIRGKIESLKMFPFRCPVLNAEDETIRALYYRRYAILYEIQPTQIIILGVKHTSTFS